MGKRILKIALAGVALVVAILSIVWLQAQPAALNPYFAPTEFKVIAHRGGRGLGPENTLTVFRLSLAAGADVLEMDVRTTADEHLVVLHDATVDRTTDGHGAVNMISLAQLKKLDAGYHWTADAGRSFPYRNRGITVPTLPEVLATVADTPLIMELKEDGPTISQLLCSELRTNNRTASVLVASALAGALERFRSACPGVATSAGPADAMRFYLLNRIGLTALYSPKEQALLVPKTFKGREVASDKFVEAAHGRNLNVTVWTVNADEDMRRLIAAGVDGIITDYPDRLADIVEETPEGG
jgi:glycerophosphoryl diester phosphodiesterase